MGKFTLHRIASARAGAVLLLLLYSGLAVHAQTRANKNSPTTSERRTARYFESLRKSPPQMYAFLKQMPKGGDLHNHLSGAVYAES
jgi:hypothetical protein